jgi:extracellular factor (EF) 3-hydroxypalmitic acid methyl ester biosynthesis protein
MSGTSSPRPEDNSPAANEIGADALRTARAAGQELVGELNRIAGQESDLDESAGRSGVAAAMDRCLATLAATGLWGRDNQVPSGEIWRIAGGVLERGYLQHRAKFKPLGYAGDYAMMTDFWDRRVRGDSPLGRWFDDYFQQQTAVDAVRARIALAASMIAERCAAADGAEFHVVSIGSGPAIDLFEAARTLPSDARRRLRFTLLDLDEAALAAAREQLSTVVDANRIDARRENLYRLTKLRGGAAVPSDVDFVLASGLFDYLADDVATVHLELYWKALRGGGRLMVGNFAPGNPSRAYMEWIGNWYLLYRTRDDFARLADGAGTPAGARHVTAETTGWDLFLIADKP